MTDEKFDELLNDVRGETTTEAEIAAAQRRVRERITESLTLLCSEFQAELGAYVGERLTDSRRLLVEDHLGRCTDCRRALAEARGEQRVFAPRPTATSRPGWMRWGLAAAAVLVMLYVGRHQVDRALAPSGPRATVISVSGDVFRLPQGELAPGEGLFEEDVIRTGAGGRAILELADGSRVELNQRTKLSVHSAWSGQTVRLDYGDLLMQAAKQRRGRLRVVTRDSTASVKGTIFAVSSATAGSLVSVVEGAVEVSQSGLQQMLEPGQQAASNSALASVGIAQALAWSEDAEKYYELLAEIMQIEKDLAALPGPALRSETRLLSNIPTGTWVYIAIPNLHGTIQEAIFLVDQRSEDNAVLNEWWSSEQGRDLRDTVDRIQGIAPLLGEEVAIVFSGSTSESTEGVPLLLAEVAGGREDDLREAISSLAGNEAVHFEIVEGLLLVSDSTEHLTIMSASLGGGASSGFAAEIASRYESGVSWLTAIDVATFRSDVSLPSDMQQVLGLPSMHYLIFEQNSDGVSGGNEATLSFNQTRTGMASWLASPGPAGSAEYVSSDAVTAFSTSMRDPRQAFDEMVSLLGDDSEFATEIEKFESETGISIGLDIAASLGTDVTFALERPTVPVPGWVIAFEAMNPGALDETARRLVEAYNSSVSETESNQSLVFSEATTNGRAWRSIALGLTGGEGIVGGLVQSMELHWTYDRGYLIASTDRALALRAIAVRASGSPLIHTARFQQRFPATSDLHHSGFFWFNTNGVVADLASLVESPALNKLLNSREPTLVVFDGEAERIHAASRTRLTSMLLDTMLVGGVGHTQAAEQLSDSE